MLLGNAQGVEPGNQPLSGWAVQDLMWDYASPLATLIFEDLECVVPAEDFWVTVSGAAVFDAAMRNTKAARLAYERTEAPVLRQVWKTAWASAQQHSIECAILLWTALLAKLRTTYPSASDGQLWVLIRDEIRDLCQELYVVEADGR